MFALLVLQLTFKAHTRSDSCTGYIDNYSARLFFNSCECEQGLLSLSQRGKKQFPGQSFNRLENKTFDSPQRVTARGMIIEL